MSRAKKLQTEKDRRKHIEKKEQDISNVCCVDTKVILIIKVITYSYLGTIVAGDLAKALVAIDDREVDDLGVCQ